MTSRPYKRGPFHSADEEARAVQKKRGTAQTLSPSYKLAFQDDEFLLREELRPVRLQLELLKPEMILQEYGIESTVVLFGSARLPDPEKAEENVLEVQRELQQYPEDPLLKNKLRKAKRDLRNSYYYEQSRKLARLISENTPDNKLVVITGGGEGVMGAANRGAYDAGAKSIGLKIALPYEQIPNAYVTPEFSFQFHYFAIRKMHFLLRAKGLVAFPGGFGTLDELFETLTLIQTGKVEKIPVLLFGKDFWKNVIRFETLVEEGTISPEDLNLFQYVETAEEAWEIISQFNGIASEIGKT